MTMDDADEKVHLMDAASIKWYTFAKNTSSGGTLGRYV